LIVSLRHVTTGGAVSLELYVGVAGIVVALVAVVIAYFQLRRTPPVRPVVEAESVAPGIGSDEKPGHNLPTRGRFIGRGAEKARMVEGLESSYPVIAVEGLGGMGKTALTREVAWLCAESDRFRAVVWTEDRDGSLRLNDVLDAIADVLGYTYLHAMPLADKEKEVTRHLKATACLLVVDNLETVTDQRLLEFVTRVPEPPSKVVVTSREQQLRSAWAVPLGRLDEPDGLELIRAEANRLGLRTLYEAPDAALLALYDAAGGNPLAIRLGTGQMKAGGASLDEIIADLADAVDDDLFTVLFERSWHRTDEYARRVLSTLALCSGPTTRAALEAGSDVRHGYLRSALTRLIAVSLVDATDAGPAGQSRYQLHTLTRAFVRRRLTDDHPTATELRGRLHGYFLGLATRNANTYEHLDNVHNIDAELANIMAFADAGHDEAERTNGRDAWRGVLGYADAMASYLWGRGSLADRTRLSTRAMAAATTLGDHVAFARHAVYVGRAHLWLGDPATARAFLDRSETALASAGPDADTSIAKRLRAQIASAEGDHDIAQVLLEEVLAVAPMTSDDEGRAATLVELGLLAERRGDLVTAKARYEEALRLDDDLAAVEGRAISLSHLGTVLLAMGDTLAAETALRDGLAASATANRLSAKARCELGLASLYARKGSRQDALRHATAAELLYGRLGQPGSAEEARAIARSLVVADGLP
jgi:tetratricopeptide (TPR) repeat protein